MKWSLSEVHCNLVLLYVLASKLMYAKLVGLKQILNTYEWNDFIANK